VIAQQRRLLQTKEVMLQKYMQQFNQLSTDYERVIDSRPSSGWLEPPRALAAVFSAPEVNLEFQPALDFPRRRLQETFSCPAIDSAPPPPPQPSVADAILGRRGLQSHICFGCGEDESAKRLSNDHSHIGIDVSGMTVDQMRAKIDELNVEKASLERQLNKALPKAKAMPHLIREREEGDETCGGVQDVSL
jgi:hypothetical protein